MTAVIRRGGGTAIVAGCFLLGRSTKRPVNFERLGLVLVAGGALVVLLDHLQEKTNAGLDRVVTTVGNGLEDLHETLSGETQTLHRDIRTVDMTARRVAKAAVELGTRIGQETEQRRTDRAMTDSMDTGLMSDSPDGKSGETA